MQRRIMQLFRSRFVPIFVITQQAVIRAALKEMCKPFFPAFLDWGKKVLFVILSQVKKMLITVLLLKPSNIEGLFEITVQHHLQCWNVWVYSHL